MSALHPMFAQLLAPVAPSAEPFKARSCGVKCEACGADDWIKVDNSFSHLFGTHVEKSYLECNLCEADFPENAA